MSSDTAIRVENLSKRYTIGHANGHTSGDGLRHTIQNAVAVPWRAFFRHVKGQASAPQSPASEDFWALSDVSFEIKRGEVLGVIGRNGAGKSTLLKILSRITEPTSGRVGVNGRVASLLEVGTGFHPELTGRENIYLNGAILGMARSEIRRKFDEIASFSGVEKFLDTPVKRYSSGMYVRLAFAVAAHLEPEILIIDEVLAVGDSEFQKRCLGKLESISTEGRTVIFVSHNMGAVQRLCTRCICLASGAITKDSTDVVATIGDYHSRETSLNSEWRNCEKSPKHCLFSPIRFALVNESFEAASGPLLRGSRWSVLIEGEILELDRSLQVGYALFDSAGTLLYWSFHTDSRSEDCPSTQVGKVKFVSPCPTDWLNEGTYTMQLLAARYNHEWILAPTSSPCTFSFSLSGGFTESTFWTGPRPGLFAPTFQWSMNPTRVIDQP